MIGITGAPASVKVADILAKLPHVTVVSPVLMQVSTAGNVEVIYGIDLKTFESLGGPFHYLSGGGFTGPEDILVDDFFAHARRVKVGRQDRNPEPRVPYLPASWSTARARASFCLFDTLQD